MLVIIFKIYDGVIILKIFRDIFTCNSWRRGTENLSAYKNQSYSNFGEFTSRATWWCWIDMILPSIERERTMKDELLKVFLHFGSCARWAGATAYKGGSSNARSEVDSSGLWDFEFVSCVRAFTLAIRVATDSSFVRLYLQLQSKNAAMNPRA